MSRKRELTGYRLIVTVGDYKPETQRRDCEAITRTLKTLSDVSSVELDAIVTDECSHCGAVWTECDSPHNGGCCDEDAKAMPDEAVSS